MLNGTQVGLYNLGYVRGLIGACYVKMEGPVWYEGCQDWIKVMDIPDIHAATSGHVVGGHIEPLFEAYNGDQTIYSLVMRTRTPLLFLMKLLPCMKRATIFGMMKVSRQVMNCLKKLPMR